jgi:hypothetical protein
MLLWLVESGVDSQFSSSDCTSLTWQREFFVWCCWDGWWQFSWESSSVSTWWVILMCNWMKYWIEWMNLPNIHQLLKFFLTRGFSTFFLLVLCIFGSLYIWFSSIWSLKYEKTRNLYPTTNHHSQSTRKLSNFFPREQKKQIMIQVP